MFEFCPAKIHTVNREKEKRRVNNECNASSFLTVLTPGQSQGNQGEEGRKVEVRKGCLDD